MKAKRIISFALAVIFLLSVATTTVFAAEEKVMSGTTGTMADSGKTDKYCVYEKASSSSKILKTYKEGQKVTIDKKTTNSAGNVWYHITSPIKGWVWSGTLKVTSNWIPRDEVEPGKVSGAYGSQGVKMEYSSPSYKDKTINWTYNKVNYQTVLKPTRIRYRVYVKPLTDWVYPKNIKDWNTTETKTTTHTIGGEVSLSFAKLGVKGNYELKLEGAKSETITFDIKTFNTDHRYRLCYWQDYLEYDAVTYMYNSKTKKYDIKVDTITTSRYKVTGKYGEIFSEPTKAFMWGY